MQPAVGLIPADATESAHAGTEADGFTPQLITPTLWAQKPDMFACNLTNGGS